MLHGARTVLSFISAVRLFDITEHGKPMGMLQAVASGSRIHQRTTETVCRAEGAHLMAAGLSKKQMYRRIYNRLQSFRYKLERAGVRSSYSKQQVCWDSTDDTRHLTVTGFNIRFDIGRASNGECGGFPRITIYYVDGTHKVYGWMCEAGTWDAGFQLLITLFARQEATCYLGSIQ